MKNDANLTATYDTNCLSNPTVGRRIEGFIVGKSSSELGNPLSHFFSVQNEHSILCAKARTNEDPNVTLQEIRDMSHILLGTGKRIVCEELKM